MSRCSAAWTLSLIHILRVNPVEKNEKSFACSAGRRYGTESVSYTHLDVYKRQEVAFHIDVTLGGAGGENSGWTVARNGDGAAGAFPAAHCKDNGFGLQHLSLIHI